MSMTQIEALLKEHMGLDSHTVGTSMIERAVQQRMKIEGHDEIADYCHKLLQSGDELHALIEAVIIPETWFFRDMRPFLALRRYLAEEWLPANIGNKLRILSIPCSTGEEPYSIAMTMEELQIPASTSQIDAVDISTENLNKARRAQYRRNSFRGDDLSYRDRHFIDEGDHYLLKDKIQQRVQFSNANMLSPGFLMGQEAYDVIFCRNLLIYFDRPTQERALSVLRRLLKAKGILFIGHAEAGLFLSSWHASKRYPSAFAFRIFDDKPATESEIGHIAVQPRNHRRRQKKPASAAPIGKRIPEDRNGNVCIISDSNQKQEDESKNDPLQKALQLADGGHLAEAAATCERLIHTEGPSAQAYYLLGVIREAAGDSTQAETFWRKALYLEPKHLEALTHLSLLLERRGEKQEAQRMRQRVERADSQRINKA